MEEFFIELFEYNNHYNQQLIAQFAAHEGRIPEKSLKLLSHIVNAQRIWNSRIIGQAASGVWDIQPNEKLAGLNQENYTRSLEIMSTRDFNELIDYVNSKGDSYSNTIKDILFHVVNHGTYHRGQIASNCRENGIEPIVSDYIFYKR